MFTSHSRQSVRSQLRERRSSLSSSQRTVMDTSICDFIARHPLWLSARSAGLYVAFDGEPNLVKLLAASGERCFLPILEGETLAFGSASAPRAENRFGIVEPDVEPAQRVGAPALDVLFAPLVGFSSGGDRLGMGAGFYDRALSHRLHGAKFPVFVGVAYAFQRTDEISAEPWDVPLDAVVTEEGWIFFGKEENDVVLAVQERARGL